MKSVNWMLHGLNCQSIFLGHTWWKVSIEVIESANLVFSLVGILTIWTAVRLEYLITEWDSSGRKGPFCFSYYWHGVYSGEPLLLITLHAFPTCLEFGIIEFVGLLGHGFLHSWHKATC